jgi:HEAT repeat protein
MRNYLRITVGLLLLASWAGAATLDDMVKDLGGKDDRAQAQARQFLPREGYAAAEKVLPLLSSEDQPVWRSAKNVLADIANQSLVRGREDEQAQLANLFSTLLAPSQPEALKINGLDLLVIVMPEKGNVKPIAALLGDPALRERARAALQAIGTSKACAALRAGLRKADPEFQAAILSSLATCRDPKSVSAAKRLLKSDNPGVRAAAARTLAWTGDAKFVEPLRNVRAASDPATHFEATDALLRLADAMAKSGQTSAAVDVYRGLVKDEASPAQAGAALASLIRYGDASVAGDVSAVLTGDKHAQFEPNALAAFEARRDDTGNALLLAVYPTTPPALRTLLIGVMGRKRDAAFDQAINAASGDAAYRAAAANALADSRRPGAAYVLANALNTTSGDEHVALQTALQRMAKSCHDDGNIPVAGEAYLALYRAADSPAIRQDALENLMKHPIPDALDAIVPALERGDLTNIQPASFVALSESLAKSGRAEEAGRIANAMASNAKSTQAVQDALQAARVSQGAAGIAPRLGFVTKWQIVGIFPHDIHDGFKKTNINEPAVDTNATYTVNGNTLKWAPLEAAPDSGFVDFGRLYGTTQNVTGYAFAKINVPADTDAVVRCGSDDGIKVWVNGQSVHENLIDRGVVLDDDEAPIKLKAGNNDILVEVTQGGGGWAFVLRLTRPDGSPIAITQ